MAEDNKRMEERVEVLVRVCTCNTVCNGILQQSADVLCGHVS